MGQLFNRILRIAKSYSYDAKTGRTDAGFDDSDDELKKIIDDLNNAKTSKETDANSGRGSESQGFSKMNPELAYTILGIAADSSIAEIKSAFKKKIKEYHPDKIANNSNHEQAKKKTQEINEAYSCLKNLKGFN